MLLAAGRGARMRPLTDHCPKPLLDLRGADQLVDPAAMPLADFIAEVMTILETQPDAPEVIVERCKPLRFAAENSNFAAVFAMVNGLH